MEPAVHQDSDASHSVHSSDDGYKSSNENSPVVSRDENVLANVVAATRSDSCSHSVIANDVAIASLAHRRGSNSFNDAPLLLSRSREEERSLLFGSTFPLGSALGENGCVGSVEVQESMSASQSSTKELTTSTSGNGTLAHMRRPHHRRHASQLGMRVPHSKPHVCQINGSAATEDTCVAREGGGGESEKDGVDEGSQGRASSSLHISSRRDSASSCASSRQGTENQTSQQQQEKSTQNEVNRQESQMNVARVSRSAPESIGLDKEFISNCEADATLLIRHHYAESQKLSSLAPKSAADEEDEEEERREGAVSTASIEQTRSSSSITAANLSGDGHSNICSNNSSSSNKKTLEANPHLQSSSASVSTPRAASSMWPTASASAIMDISSSSSVGGHHFSLTFGRTFMKESCSRREERFYSLISQYQEELVADAVRHAEQTIARRHLQGIRGKQHHHGSDTAAEGSHERRGMRTNGAATAAGNSTDVLRAAEEEYRERRWQTHRSREAQEIAFQQHATNDASASEENSIDIKEEAISLCTSPTVALAKDGVGHSAADENKTEVTGESGGGGDDDDDDDDDGDDETASVLKIQSEAQESQQAALLWWTLPPRPFARGDVIAYEVQRMAMPQQKQLPLLSNVFRSLSATPSASGVPLPPPQNGETRTQNSSGATATAAVENLVATSLTSRCCDEDAGRGNRDACETGLHRPQATRKRQDTPVATPPLALTHGQTADPTAVTKTINGDATEAQQLEEAEEAREMERAWALRLFAPFVPRFFGTRILRVTNAVWRSGTPGVPMAVPAGSSPPVLCQLRGAMSSRSPLEQPSSVELDQQKQQHEEKQFACTSMCLRRSSGGGGGASFPSAIAAAAVSSPVAPSPPPPGGAVVTPAAAAAAGQTTVTSTNASTIMCHNNTCSPVYSVPRCSLRNSKRQQRQQSCCLPAKPVDADNNEDSEVKKTIHMIVLEDVCYGFTHPCVLDIKMGCRQYGLHPSPEKKRSKERKARLSTSGAYGIRLAGYKRWNEQQQHYDTRTKLQCRSLTLPQVKQELSGFLLNSRHMEHVFRHQLEKLRVSFSQQSVFCFYTSSLLFVYDAARPAETARIVMVDFAYTYDKKELEQCGDPDAEYDYDVGYLRAIDTLLSLLA